MTFIVIFLIRFALDNDNITVIQLLPYYDNSIVFMCRELEMLEKSLSSCDTL